MKKLDSFEQTISSHLELRAIQDPLFAETLKKPNKSIEECVQYIYNEVQKTKRTGFNDNEIYAMAVHYYDEDDLTAKGVSRPHVVVNHHKEFIPTPVDEEEIKKQAMERLITKEMERLKSKGTKKQVVPEAKKEEAPEVQKSLFD